MIKGNYIRNQDVMHFLTLTIVDWVDVFTRKKYRDILLDSLLFCQNEKGLTLTAYVIMSNHIHLIAQSENGRLSDLIRDFKKFTAQKILEEIETPEESRSDWMLKRFLFAARNNQKHSEHQFWKTGNHPEEIFSERFLWTKINYIHMNPVRAGIVSKASDYLYSSASNYVDRESLIPVTIAGMPIINPLKSKGFDVDIMSW
ncbi:transposase [Emticicia sp. CRIBPO]|uniref:REP-associated tyrosine transposase n=1 Tax=Emticicia sp. CRIBPO TaxID=2683258 RepID=UPI001411F3B9|nr:transposase [Emticicia sp. CRIBPO]NBA88296.1 transposase [Emticicia sp. CRIBPO]